MHQYRHIYEVLVPKVHFVEPFIIALLNGVSIELASLFHVCIHILLDLVDTPKCNEEQLQMVFPNPGFSQRFKLSKNVVSVEILLLSHGPPLFILRLSVFKPPCLSAAAWYGEHRRHKLNWKCKSCKQKKKQCGDKFFYYTGETKPAPTMGWHQILNEVLAAVQSQATSLNRNTRLSTTQGWLQTDKPRLEPV